MRSLSFDRFQKEMTEITSRRLYHIAAEEAASFETMVYSDHAKELKTPFPINREWSVVFLSVRANDGRALIPHGVPTPDLGKCFFARAHLMPARSKRPKRAYRYGQLKLFMSQGLTEAQAISLFESKQPYRGEIAWALAVIIANPKLLEPLRYTNDDFGCEAMNVEFDMLGLPSIPNSRWRALAKHCATPGAVIS